MSKLGKMVKDMVKTKKESVMGKLGDSPYEDPMEPWSVKYNQPVKEETLAEDSILYRYIRSKGYSPEHMDFAHRSAFARSRAFKSYKILHQKTLEKPQGGLNDIIVQKEEVQEADFSKYIMKPTETEPKIVRKTNPSGRTTDHVEYEVHGTLSTHKRTFKSKKDAEEYFKTVNEVSGAELYKASAETSKAKLSAMKAMDATHKYQKDRLSKSAAISEAGVGKLMNFIKAKGLDPTSMDGNQKKNYSGSSEYRVFKVLHPEDPKKQLLQDKKKKLKETSGMGERGEDWADATDEPFVKVKAKTKKLKEEADEIDTVTMDIPLLIRILEFAREDAKTDMDLHKVVENLIKMRGDGTLSMQSYAKIVAIKEHLESLDELSKKTLGSYIGKALSDSRWRARRMGQGINWSGAKDNIKTVSKRESGMRNAAARLTKEEVEELAELSKETLKSYQHKASVSRGENSVAAIKSKDSDRSKYLAVDAKRTKGLDAVRKRIDAKNKADAAKNMDHPKEPLKSKYPLGGRDEKSGRSYSEEVEELSELSKETLKSYVDKVSTGPSRGKTQTGTLKSIKAIGGVTKAIRKQYEKPVNELKKQADNMDFDDHLTREENENISELANKTLRNYIRKTRDNPERKVGNDRALKKHSERMEKGAASGKEYHTLGSIVRKLKNEEYSLQKEATGPCWKGYMMVGSKMKGGKSVPNCVPSNRKNIVKSAAKKKIRESMYDWEKDDKGNNKKPNAKVVMKGGTTLTGKPRDTVEIEPVLKTRPNSASGGKPSV
jgi:hypothetical protein